MKIVPPTKVTFACDESGAKGYSDLDEAYPGEVGVFAGILIPDECFAAALVRFQKIYDLYQPGAGKHHIADLGNDKKESLRLDVYQAIRDFKLPCFWYAIHVAGLHEWHKSVDAIERDRKASLALERGDSVRRIKGGSPRSAAASMHVELFAGLHAHVVAFLEERMQSEVDIEIQTDQVDSPLVKEFEIVAKRLLCEEPHFETTKGFDTVTKQVVQGSVKVEVKYPPALRMQVVVRSLTINPVVNGSAFVLAADVLANSLNHHFKNRDEHERYRPLNHPEAVATHPLFQQLDAFHNWGEGDLVGDRIYQHPRAPKD